MKIFSEQSNADMKKNICANRTGINEITFYICFAGGKRAIWCQIFARIFHPMILHVNDVSVILDRKHNRDYERAIEIYRLCNFPHIRFC